MDERSSLIHNLEVYFSTGTQEWESDVDIAVHMAESASLELLIGTLCFLF